MVRYLEYKATIRRNENVQPVRNKLPPPGHQAQHRLRTVTERDRHRQGVHQEFHLREQSQPQEQVFITSEDQNQQRQGGAGEVIEPLEIQCRVLVLLNDQ